MSDVPRRLPGLSPEVQRQLSRQAGLAASAAKATSPGIVSDIERARMDRIRDEQARVPQFVPHPDVAMATADQLRSADSWLLGYITMGITLGALEQIADGLAEGIARRQRDAELADTLLEVELLAHQVLRDDVRRRMLDAAAKPGLPTEISQGLRHVPDQQRVTSAVRALAADRVTTLSRDAGVQLPFELVATMVDAVVTTVEENRG